MSPRDDLLRPPAGSAPAAGSEPATEGEHLLEWILPSLGEDATDRRPRPADPEANPPGRVRRAARRPR